MSIIETIRNRQNLVFAARKSARRLINARPVNLMAEFREAYLDAIEIEPEMLKRLGIAPKIVSFPGRKVNGKRTTKKRECGKSLSELLAEVENETAADRARERELCDILSRVSNYALQFEQCKNPATFEISYAPFVPLVIRKLKNDD